MKPGKVEKYIIERIGENGALLFILIDPCDYRGEKEAVNTAKNAYEGGADVILVGGSIGAQGELLDNVVKGIKDCVSVPVVLFPGNIGTVSKYADAVYFMSLLNSRNAYWITGAQALAAHAVKKLGIEPLPVGYVLIHPGGTAGWVGDVNLVPRDKPDIAASLALAADCCGFRFLVTDCGSAPATGPMSVEMVRAVREATSAVYIVGGGIRTPKQAREITNAGADAIQVGTAVEKVSDVVGVVKALSKAVREGARSRKIK
ncbi:MAG: geranylgeranylglyceryl/heptaprenylglyceryl phosphate synthase [Candidatus Micrarchaeia archaeon]